MRLGVDNSKGESGEAGTCRLNHARIQSRGLNERESGPHEEWVSELSRPAVPSHSNAKYPYPAIKHWSAVVAGVPSQCTQAGKVKTMGTKPQFLSGLLLKINLKLKGENVHPGTVGLMAAMPTIVIGVDVNHAAPGR